MGKSCPSRRDKSAFLGGQGYLCQGGRACLAKKGFLSLQNGILVEQGEARGLP